MGKRGIRKKRIGIVISNKMQKTVVVEVERRYIDPKYRKVVRKKKKFKAHDEENKCGIGDMVLIMETRPLSRDKRWRIATIIEKSNLKTGPRVITDTMGNDTEIGNDL